MSDEDKTEVDVDDERVARRAAQLGGHPGNNEGAEAQARAILEDSDLRTEDREAAPGSFVEHRSSEDTVPPDDIPA